MSKKGQIVIPAEVRDRYALQTGDIFRIGGHNGVIVIQKIQKMTDREAARLAAKPGKPGNPGKRVKVQIEVEKVKLAPAEPLPGK